jgi:hypothetical protein
MGQTHSSLPLKPVAADTVVAQHVALVVFRSGQEIERHCGAMTEGQLDLWLQPHLQKTT